MRTILYTAILIATPLLLFTGGIFPVYGQELDEQRERDSLRIMELYLQARADFDRGEPYQALSILGDALELAMQLNLEQSEAGVMELIGDIYISEGEAEEAIPYFLQVASVFEFAGDSAELKAINHKIGDAYSEAEVHEKAYEYYLKVGSSLTGGEVSERRELAEKLGTASLLSGQAEEAVEHFLQFGEMLERQGEEPVQAWTHLVNAFRETGNYKECLDYSERLLDHYNESDNYSRLALLHNNLGYYHTELKQYPEALEHYNRAVELGEEAGLPAGRIAVMKANMGVCYQNMNETKEANDHLNLALDRLKKENFPAERSRIENIQALLYFNENDLYNAGIFCRDAISSAEEAGNRKLLSDAYLTYSRVLRAGNDPVNALQYYESYLAIRDSLERELNLQEEQAKQRISRMDRSERDLLLRLQEEKVNELAINRLTMQLQQEEQARELLIRENDLRLLEQERLRQSLIITEQQHEVERQERENRLLEQEQRLARLALEQEQQKQREAEQEIRLLEQQQELDQLSLERQKEQRKLLIGIVILMVLVVVLVTGSLLSTRRKNMMLARQKKEIEEKNLDLEQKNEEISAQRDEIEAQRDEIEAQRDLLFEQKEDIEQFNLDITNSIEYAKRIQSSTLPNLEQLRKFTAGYFLLFRPRDIVSGDFYWLARVEETTVLVVADCTGHGVPGAFMSMLGMSLLKEIVQKEYLTHPGVILRRMRKEIIRSLDQKGESGEQRDGMDISLIEINHKENRIQFAGAYNSLYLVRDRKLKAPAIEGMTIFKDESENASCLYEVPGDRMPVAFFDRMDKFTTHTLTIEEGDRLYMYTDGYPDQFGGERGKKFKYKPFKKLILDHAALSMDEQYKVLSQTLDDWKGDYDQVDDICMIGLKF